MSFICFLKAFLQIILCFLSFQVPVLVENLRSRSSLVLLNVDSGTTFIWHGVKCPKDTRELCFKAVENLKQKWVVRLNGRNGMKGFEMSEGDWAQ